MTREPDARQRRHLDVRRTPCVRRRALTITLTGALVVPTLGAQAPFGQLQYATPPGTRVESPAAVMHTDSTAARTCRFGVLADAPAKGDPAADHRAAFAEASRVVGLTPPQPSSIRQETLASGHVTVRGESELAVAGGRTVTVRVFTWSGGGRRAAAFVQFTSLLRCLLPASRFESSLVPVGSAGAVVADAGAGAPPAARPAAVVSPPDARASSAAATPASRRDPAPPSVVEPATGGAIGTRGWAFTSTRFADGWTATIEEEWVVGRKGELAVRLHHPREELERYLPTTREDVIRAWNVLVAPRYRDIANWVIEQPRMEFPPRAFGWAEATEAATGRRVFVALAYMREKGRRFVEVVAPDRATFEAEWGAFDAGRVRWDAILALQGMNRFPVALTDLAGEWSDRFSASYDLRTISTGAYAGTFTAGYSTTFVVSGGSYRLTVVGGEGTHTTTQVRRQEDTGPIGVGDGWVIRLGNRAAGRPAEYWARFESVRGGRALVMGTPGDDFPSLRFVKVR